MWNEKSPEQLAKNIPPLYATDGTPFADKMIYEHFFIGSSDWYVAEYDPESDTAFGFVILNGDKECSEWGYISIAELRTISIKGVEVDRNMHLTPMPAKGFKNIKTYS